MIRWTSRRALQLLAVAMGSAILLTGCSVVEVIDNIGKDTKPKPTADAKTAKSAKSDANLPPAADGSARAKLREYYNRRPAEPEEEDPNNPIVRCAVHGDTQFMRKYDCTLRGGRELG